MTLPRVLMCSMFRNDAWSQIGHRVRHLLAKAETYENVRWLWLVGDSRDETVLVLRELTAGREDVTIVEVDTGIGGDDADSRLYRMGQTANHYFKHVRPTDDFILIHESDIVSPPDLVNRFVAHAQNGYCPIAGWPTLEIRPSHKIFYDTLAYVKDGKRFGHTPPYHQCYQRDKVFSVDSFGTCFMFEAADAPHVLMDRRAVLDLCWHLRERGHTLYVDPTLEVVQPTELWVRRGRNG